MSSVKNLLKKSRDCVGKKDFTGAKEAAKQALEYEPQNYTANVLFGLALLELGELQESEQAYLMAIESSPEQQLAWQGISKFYERTENWAKYTATLQTLTNNYAKLEDAVKCGETLQKLIEVQRYQGTRMQLVEALFNLLPQSTSYRVLSSLPPPDPTNPTVTTTFDIQTAIYNSLSVIQELVSLVEKEEDETLQKEVEKRRTRLGASRPEILRKEVGREIWSVSQLPQFYNDILNHPDTPDDLRRETDTKLLKYKQRYLHALPDTKEAQLVKQKLAKEVDDLVNGTVLLKIADELAWTIFLESQDCERSDEFDFRHLQSFIELFPASPMSLFLKTFLLYIGQPQDLDGSDDNKALILDDDDILDSLLAAYPGVSNTLIGNQSTSEAQLDMKDYESAIKTANKGLQLLTKAEIENGKKHHKTRRGFQVTLATAFVNYYPPKHHTEALSIIDEVLSQCPDNVPCLMGRAYVFEEAKQWEQAANMFKEVSKLRTDDIDVVMRSKEEESWCLCQSQGTKAEIGLSGLLDVLETLKTIPDRDDDLARCFWRVGETYWNIGGTGRTEAYKFFISSLKCDPAYAPAFTSLGFYYAEGASPPDPVRASKCFQKAFELSPRETRAARRLAEGFADDREWDLVEIVARRTIQGEGGMDAGMKNGDTTRYLLINAWAWKAVGVVELNQHKYPAAIQCFQTALRADPNDYSSWIRLGEAYCKAGRHIAAVKALEHALTLNPDDWVCLFFIGDTKHQMGLFSEAIKMFKTILNTHSQEAGVLAALGRSYIEQGRIEYSTGFPLRAEKSFITTIKVGLEMFVGSPGFRGIAWKFVADAIFHLSRCATLHNANDIISVLQEILTHMSEDQDNGISKIMQIPSLSSSSFLEPTRILEISIFAYSNCITFASKAQTSNGSAWYDLAVALDYWVSRTSKSPNAPAAKEKAVDLFIKALKEDPGNATYWVALGNARFASQPKLAQHAYINALELDSKDVTAWTNLGLLYYHNDDLTLANDALYRAQVLDPDHAPAWVGQSLVAAANGHDVDARALLEHSVELSTSVPQADYATASTVFSQRTRRLSKELDLLPTFFLLDRYCRQRPQDPAGLHLFALVSEHVGHLMLARELVERAIVILETSYEESEDPLVENHYMISNLTLARLRLSLGDFAGAVESFDSAMGLLPDEDTNTFRPIRVQALFGSGLAHFYQGDLEAALGLLQEALDSSGDDLPLRGHASILLAQVMWAVGTEEYKESAKALLLDCISADPQNLIAMNTLAGMGILTDDDHLVEAALSEIVVLPIDERRTLDPQQDVGYLMTQHYLRQSEVDKSLSVAQANLFMEPSALRPRRELAELVFKQGRGKSALALLSGSPPVNLANESTAYLRQQAIARCSMGTELGLKDALRISQTAILLAPSEVRNWQALAYVQSRSQGQ